MVDKIKPLLIPCNYEKPSLVKSNSKASSTQPVGESVAISNEANVLQHFLDAEPTNEIDEKKLSAIKEAIINGKYKIDYDKLSQLLIEME